jgi:hypothetical protein
MKIVKTLLVVLALITAISCSKYESGPFLSLTSKKNRITGSWTYTAVYRNGLDITSGIDTSGYDYSQSSIGFAEDNRFSHYDLIHGVESNGDGFWDLIDDDETFQLIYENADSTIKKYRITRLERNFLWYEEKLDNNTTLEFQLIPSN